MSTTVDVTMDLKERGKQLQNAIKATIKGLKAQEKAISDCLDGDAKEDAAKLRKGLAAWDESVLERLGQAEEGAELRTAARARLKALREEQRRGFARDLGVAAQEAGRPFRRLTENPPEFRIPPFTVRLDTETMEAVVLYAREELARVPARAEAIVKEFARQEKEFESRKLHTADEFRLLLGAYRAAAATQGKRIGERVDLADVLPFVAALRQGTKFREDPAKERFASYPRARFLWDLNRLRAARLLEQDGMRLDLGTATGDSVRKKRRVFFLEDVDGHGQYYLSLRFVPSGRI